MTMNNVGITRKTNIIALKRLLLTLMIFLIPALTEASLIMNFGNGGALNLDGYTESGMTISNSANFPRISDWETAATEREMLFNELDGDITFSLVSGGLFNLLSFDIELPGSNFSADGEFSLTDSNGVVFQFSAATVSTQTLSTILAPIAWFTVRTTGQSGQATIDNIDFSLVQSVPIPATLALFGLGLAGFGFSRRKAT